MGGHPHDGGMTLSMVCTTLCLMGEFHGDPFVHESLQTFPFLLGPVLIWSHGVGAAQPGTVVLNILGVQGSNWRDRRERLLRCWYPSQSFFWVLVTCATSLGKFIKPHVYLDLAGYFITSLRSFKNEWAAMITSIWFQISILYMVVSLRILTWLKK